MKPIKRLTRFVTRGERAPSHGMTKNRNPRPNLAHGVHGLAFAMPPLLGRGRLYWRSIMPLYSLILAWTINGASIAPPAASFANRDLCEAAAFDVERDIVGRGGKLHIARCVLVSIGAK